VFPSGSRHAAKWQTPESHVSAMNSTPFASSSALACATSATRIANPAVLARERLRLRGIDHGGTRRQRGRRDVGLETALAV
jgi:hypothetical protein